MQCGKNHHVCEREDFPMYPLLKKTHTYIYIYIKNQNSSFFIFIYYHTKSKHHSTWVTWVTVNTSYVLSSGCYCTRASHSCINYYQQHCHVYYGTISTVVGQLICCILGILLKAKYSPYASPFQERKSLVILWHGLVLHAPHIPWE